MVRSYGTSSQFYMRLQENLRRSPRKCENCLQGAIKRLDTWESLSPEVMFAFYSKNIDKIIQIVKNFKENENESVYAYLCSLMRYPKFRTNVKQRN